MLLTVRQLAKKLSIHTSTIYLWIKENKIPYIKFNGVIRFDDKEVEDFIKVGVVR